MHLKCAIDIGMQIFLLSLATINATASIIISYPRDSPSIDILSYSHIHNVRKIIIIAYKIYKLEAYVRNYKSSMIVYTKTSYYNYQKFIGKRIQIIVENIKC